MAQPEKQTLNPEDDIAPRLIHPHLNQRSVTYIDLPLNPRQDTPTPICSPSLEERSRMEAASRNPDKWQSHHYGSFLRNHVYALRKPAGPLNPPSFAVKTLGEATIENLYEAAPFNDGVTVLRTPLFKDGIALAEEEFVEVAGPRSKLFFDPTKATAAIVTCGGLCPGLNNVIRALWQTLCDSYHVKRVLGFMYGYEGLTPAHDPIELTYQQIKDIHLQGGSILGTSRGQQPAEIMVDTLLKHKIDMLFVIGGDGTMQGALSIAKEVEKRGAKIAIVGVPKTIDNDIPYTDVTFGFQTAVSRSMEAIYAVHDEAKSAVGGIGIVKLMGRDAGFIALNASLSNGDVNMVLIPEVEFTLDAVNAYVEKRLKRPDRGHCVIVVAEGAGQHLLRGTPDEYDKSGNRLQKDIGKFLVSEIHKNLEGKKIEHTIKYVDPSYIIRSAVAIPSDAMLCILLAANAVHAALSGRTEIVLCHHHNTYIHVPISRAVFYLKKVNPAGPLYRTFIDVTGMPAMLTPKPQGLTPTPEEFKAQQSAAASKPHITSPLASPPIISPPLTSPPLK